MIDNNPFAPGVQTDVKVRADPQVMSTIRLEVATPDGLIVSAMSTTVDQDGVALFSDVTLPGPIASLTATGDGTCGTAQDQMMVNVSNAPALAVEVVHPALDCGTTTTPASDVDPSEDGVQVVAHVRAPSGDHPSLSIANAQSMTDVDASTDVEVTLEPGANTFVATALDGDGHAATSDPCVITLANLSVSFSPPAASGILNAKNGTVSAGQLTTDICGTVNAVGANVTLEVDDGPAMPAAVNNTSWCRTVVLAESPPAHTVVATALMGDKFGQASIVLTVDLTSPDTIADLTGVVLDRQRMRLRWTAPADHGATVAAYLIKRSTTQLTDANFDTSGVVVAPPPPQAPGNAEVFEISSLRTGSPEWMGIAAVDLAGNRSAAAIVGPQTPVFFETPAIVPPDPTLGNVGLGAAIAHGKFNDDDFDDLAVAAPTQNVGSQVQAGAVYVYFGGPDGIAATPSLVIQGVASNGHFGSAVTAVRWTSAMRDDLVVGAPGVDAGNGTVYIFHPSLTTGTRLATSADQVIRVHPTTPGWFATASLGKTLATADFDGDDNEDLIIGATTGGGNHGGVAIIYGGTASGDVLLSNSDQSMLGASVDLIVDPGGSAGRQFGFYLHDVGPTRGAADTTDDLVIAPADDPTTAGDVAYVFRGDGVRPAGSALAVRTFSVGRDVEIDFVTSTKVTEWASQVVSIADQNGDGARDLVISAYGDFNGSGSVLILDGATLGTGGIARTTDPGMTIATITNTGGSRFGAVVVGHDSRSVPDVDGDGLDDLLIGGLIGTSAKLFVWFGGSIPHGTVSAGTAGYIVTGPTTFLFNRATPQGAAGQAIWVGDLNGDGLDDVCWSSPNDNLKDGSFAVLSDASE